MRFQHHKCMEEQPSTLIVYVKVAIMLSKKIFVENEHGIHARVALRVVEACRKSGSDITVCKGCEKADGCSIMQLLMLGAAQGSEVDVVVDGGNEQQSMRDLTDIFSGGAGI